MSSRAVQLALAFLSVYLIWGSTYLAIRVVVATLPPALSSGLRFLVAGSVMMIFALWRGGRLPASWRDWASVAFTGFIMLVAGHGMVSWSEQWVESNQAALIVATSALWMAGMGAIGRKGDSLGPLTLVGLVAGFGGVALLVGGGLTANKAPPLAYGALLLAPILWAVGSVQAKRFPVNVHWAVSAALQMLVAGVLLCGIGLMAGDLARMRYEPRSAAALAYLIVFGSCIAYGAFFYLVHQVSPAMLGTYAYVNPAIAVVLGWWLLDEQLDRTQLAGTGVILLGVVLVTLGSRRKPAA